LYNIITAAKVKSNYLKRPNSRYKKKQRGNENKIKI